MDDAQPHPATRTMQDVLVTKRRAYQLKTVIFIIGMSWGSLAYGWVAATLFAWNTGQYANCHL